MEEAVCSRSFQTLLELASYGCSYTLRGELYNPCGRRLFNVGFVASACSSAFLEFGGSQLMLHFSVILL